jgi:hypothetical protein
VAVVCDVVEGLIKGQEATAHVADVFPFSAHSADLAMPTPSQRRGAHCARRAGLSIPSRHSARLNLFTVQNEIGDRGKTVTSPARAGVS